MRPVARMKPGVSPKSGRKFFTGWDAEHGRWRLIEDKRSGGQRWTLKYEAPERAYGAVPDGRPLDGPRSWPPLAIEEMPD